MPQIFERVRAVLEAMKPGEDTAKAFAEPLHLAVHLRCQLARWLHDDCPGHLTHRKKAFRI